MTPVRQALVVGFLLLSSACTTTKTVYLEPPPDPNKPPGSTVPSAGLDPSIFPQPGATTFVTANEQELLSDSSGQYANGSSARGQLDDGDPSAGAGTTTPSVNPPAAPAVPAEPAPDPSRLIVEGDIYQVVGNLLYVMHRYRGLLIFDVSDPDHFKLLGRLPFQAMPVEMYVRDGRAYAIVSDYFTYWQYDKDADPLGFHGSMVLIADVSQPSSPILLGKTLVDGEVTDTRMVGDVLYVVSKRNPDYWRYDTADWQDTTWVKSINIADPTNIHEVATLEFPGASTLMHVYYNAIYVAATDPNAYLTDPAHEDETLLTYVDIADPGGAITQRGSLYIPGYISDKFKLDYDTNTLRVLSQRSPDGTQSDGYLHTVDVTQPDNLTLLTSLDLSINDYGYLTASRMDGNRGYALTERYDQNQTYNELHVLDLTDPHAPQVSGTLRVDGQVSYFEVHGDRLLAMGQNYDSNESYAAVSLFDVSNAAAPKLISSARLGSGSSYSLANGDYKAFKVLDDLGLILVPLNYNDGNTSFQGIQLIDYSASGVTARGLVGNAGSVDRAFAVGDRLVALSQFQVQVIDARNRDIPTVTSSKNLIRNVLGIWDIQGNQVQLVGDVLDQKSHFEVIPFGVADDAPSLASLDLPCDSPPTVFRDGNMLRLIGWENMVQVIRNADFTDPQNPTLRGSLTLTDDYDRIYNDGFPFYYIYWSPTAGLPLENHILPVTIRTIVDGTNGRRDFNSTLKLIDLRDADNPRVADGAVPMSDFPFVNKVTHGNVLHSSHVEETKTDDGTTLLFHVKAYLDRIDVSDPNNPVAMDKVNIPGYLVDVSDDGNTAYTVDYQWDAFGRRRNSLNVLQLEGSTARLVSVLPVGDQVNRAVFRDRTLWLVTHKYPWYGVQSDTLDSRQPYTALSRIDVDSGGNIAASAEAKLAGYAFDLLDVQGNRAYLSTDDPTGVLVLDITNPADPTNVTSARTIGYVSEIVVHNDVLYMPLGYFGVQEVDASAASMSATN